MLIRTALLAVTGLVILTLTPAHAQSARCAGIVQVNSKSLFDSSGFTTTRGPSAYVITDCENVTSGLFVNIFGIKSLTDSMGDEVDLRVGRRFDVSGIKFEASAAPYFFEIAGGQAVTVLNARIAASYTIKAGNGWSLTPYLWFDYQRVINFDGNIAGFKTGMNVAYEFDRAWKPRAGLDIGMWNYAEHFLGRQRPIVYVSPSFGFELPGTAARLTAIATFTWGDVRFPGDASKTEQAYSLNLTVPFGW